MNIFATECERSIILGRSGETFYDTVSFPIKAWKDKYGAVSFELLHQRSQDSAPYVVANTVEMPDHITDTGDFLVWRIYAVDTAYIGEGIAQLWMEAEGLKKSERFTTKVEWAFNGETSEASPYQDILEDVIENKNAAEAAAEDAEDSAEAAEASKEAAEAAAETAEQAAEAKVAEHNEDPDAHEGMFAPAEHTHDASEVSYNPHKDYAQGTVGEVIQEIDQTLYDTENRVGDIEDKEADWDAKAEMDDIPTKTSELTNNSGFITNLVADLAYYYKKTETYTQEQVNQLISAIETIGIKYVDVLPTASADTMGNIYLVPAESPSTQDEKDEFITIVKNDAFVWEHIGSTAVDLTDYAKKTWVQTQIADFLTGAEIQALITTAVSDKLTNTGDGSNVTAAFTQAETRANIATGEKLSVIFGKIKKWFADLSAVAFSGSYNDLSNKPTIPTDADAITYDDTVEEHPDGSVGAELNSQSEAIVTLESDVDALESGKVDLIGVKTGTFVLDVFDSLPLGHHAMGVGRNSNDMPSNAEWNFIISKFAGTVWGSVLAWNNTYFYHAPINDGTFYKNNYKQLAFDAEKENKGKITISGTEYTVSKHTLSWVDSGTTHSYEVLTAEVE